MLLDMISHNKNYTMESPKGLKLDFKTIEAFEASLPILNEYYPKVRQFNKHQLQYDLYFTCYQVEFPLWFNADILPGPGENNNKVPVDAHRFLDGAANFPESKLSLGTNK